MPRNFEAFIAGLDRLQLISYHFEARELRFQVFHPESGRLISVAVPTDTVHARSTGDDQPRRVETIQLIPLVRRLGIRNDRYCPPTDSRTLMADARDRVMLAYGRRCAESGYLLAVGENPPLLCCLVRDPMEIAWAEE